MKLQTLETFETLNNENLSLICGGQSAVKPSRRWDSTSQDSKKHDTYNAEVSSIQ
jgi:hypothetical protein